jgi:DNA-directed RNA polymerase specialized sigma24 family protein
VNDDATVEALLAAARAGDPLARATLVDREVDAAYRFAHVLTGDPTSAAACVREGFARTWSEPDAASFGARLLRAVAAAARTHATGPALRGLTEEARDVVALQLATGLDYAALGDTLGVDRDTVRSRLQRGWLQLAGGTTP